MPSSMRQAAVTTPRSRRRRRRHRDRKGAAARPWCRARGKDDLALVQVEFIALSGGTFPLRRLLRLRGKARATAIRARTRQRQPPPTGSGRTLTTAAWAADGRVPRAPGGIIMHDARLDGRGQQHHPASPRSAAAGHSAPEHRCRLLSGRPARLWITVMRAPAPQARAAGRRRYRSGQDQPPDPAHDAQPGRSRILPQIANPAPASASKEDKA